MGMIPRLSPEVLRMRNQAVTGFFPVAFGVLDTTTVGLLYSLLKDVERLHHGEWLGAGAGGYRSKSVVQGRPSTLTGLVTASPRDPRVNDHA